MKLQITTLPDSNTLRLAGDLDIYSVESARDALLVYLADKPAIELDLDGVETCDAAGMQLLLAARRSAVAAGKAFAIHTPVTVIEKCGEALGLEPVSRQPHNPGSL
jgi:anti-anti-sigma factor